MEDEMKNLKILAGVLLTATSFSYGVDYTQDEAIKQLEKQVLSLTLKDKTTREQLEMGLVNCVVNNNLHGVTLPTVDWSNTDIFTMADNLIALQSVKSQKRFNNSPYKTNYNGGVSYNNSQISDPYSLVVTLNDQTYKVIFNYNGNSQQVGNNLVVRDNNTRIVYSTEIDMDQFNSGPYKLLLANEIARRKALDPHKDQNQLDEHANIPVALGIKMAIKLIENQHIFLNAFWTQKGNYHIFSGTNLLRIDNFNNLVKKYKEHYSILPTKIEEELLDYQQVILKDYNLFNIKHRSKSYDLYHTLGTKLETAKQHHIQRKFQKCKTCRL